MTQPPPYPQPYPDPYGQQPYPSGPQGPQQPYSMPQAYPGQGQPAGYQQPYGAPGYQQAYPAAQGYQQPYQEQSPAYPAQPSYQQAPGGPAPIGDPFAYGTGLTCRVCGSGPAAQATFRGVVGAVIMHTIWTATGPFCRDCGLATFRKQTTKTLAGGWCSVGAVIMAPFFLLFNVVARGKIANLPAPQRHGGGPAPLDPGPPVFQRPAAYVYPVLFILFWMLVIIGNLSQ